MELIEFVWDDVLCLDSSINKEVPAVTRKNFQFILNGKLVDIAAMYTYLYLLPIEFLSYEEMTKAVAKSASRAFSL